MKTSSNYQSMIWKRAQEACPSIPRPEDENGWYLNDEGILNPGGSVICMHTTGILWVFKRAELSEPAVHLCSIVASLL